jgi:choline/glycine/proline betaine transport protein
VFGRTPESRDKFFRLEVFTAQGSEGFDVYGLTKAQISSNVLDHYERHHHYIEGVNSASATVSNEQTVDWSADFVDEMLEAEQAELAEPDRQAASGRTKEVK